MIWATAKPALSWFAVLCVLALAGILISPAVPSPPTVLGKAFHASVTSLALAVLPPACVVASVVLGVSYGALEYVVRPGESAAGAAFLPLRR